MDSDSSSPHSSVERDVLAAFLDEYLETARVQDYCPNGVQVEGRSQIRKIVTGVSACQELFETARQAEADAVLVHHGLFWRGTSRTLTGVQYRRVAELILGEINLFAYHLPLDRHLEVGNNAVAARRLELIDIEAFAELEGLSIGVAGRFRSVMARASLVDELTTLYAQKPLVFAFGSEDIERVAIVSGSGGRFLNQAAIDGIDLFITGEAEEWTMNLARELRINFVAAGHYATERLGVQALGDLLRRKFGIAVDFVDIPNPV